MDTLVITKSDVKFLLILVSLAPVFAFIVGVSSVMMVSHTGSADTHQNISQIEATHFGAKEPLAAKQPEKIETNELVMPAKVMPASINSGVVHRSKYVKQYVVQAGVFAKRENARRFAYKLKKLALSPTVVRDFSEGVLVYRVNLGAFGSRKQAKNFSRRLAESHPMELHITYSNPSRSAHAIAAL